ncbi:MAG: pantetheine-phosphate adenylyltransferase [Oligoflexia bacterium]|nr:pantetheine-phosphate adenylyltransferase [Oligoflexia bacterium]
MKSGDPKNIAVYPGSFDPVTSGHIDIIQRAKPFFYSLHILVAENPSKSTLFSIDERVEMIKSATSAEKNIIVSSFSGLVVDYARKVNAKAIVRGLRAVSDFDYEFQMATMNRRLAPDIETIFFTTRGKFFYISSSMIKSIAQNGGDISSFVPESIEQKIINKFK